MVVILAYLAAVPLALNHVDEIKPFLDPTVKRAFFLVSAGVGSAFVVASLAIFLTGLGAVGVLYGKHAGAGQPLLLASPLGCLGWPSRRIRLAAGDAVVRVVAHPPRSPAYAYGRREVVIRQGDRQLRVSSVVRLKSGSRLRLFNELQQAGVRVAFDGDIGFLP